MRNMSSSAMLWLISSSHSLVFNTFWVTITLWHSGYTVIGFGPPRRCVEKLKNIDNVTILFSCYLDYDDLWPCYDKPGVHGTAVIIIVLILSGCKDLINMHINALMMCSNFCFRIQTVLTSSEGEVLKMSEICWCF